MSLKKKIPPPIIAFACVMIGWFLTKMFPIFHIGLGDLRFYLALPFLALGFAIILYAGFQFLKNKTTVNPHSPEKTTTLVTNGLYRLSRNPMYLSMALLLSGIMIYLSSALALLSIPLFVMIINRLQIEPEEEALENLFGEDYRHYKTRVRRWF